MAHRECYLEAVAAVEAEATGRGRYSPTSDAMRLLAAEMKAAARDMLPTEISEIDAVIQYLVDRIDVLARDVSTRFTVEDFARVVKEILARELHRGAHRRARELP